MPLHDQQRSPDDPPARLSADELALRLGISRERVDRLAQLGVIDGNADRGFDPGDIHRVRLMLAFEAAGVSLESLTRATESGAVSLRYYDQLHPPPGELADDSYAAFATASDSAREYVPQLFAAFGLAEPDPGSRLTVQDERLLADLLRTIDETGQPDLVLRAIRMFGEGARRAADGALGVYAEATDRLGDGLEGLPMDEVFERDLRPWATFAQQTGALGEWLSNRHLSRAIDEYSVTHTEHILEAAGFVAARVELPPAVAFIDLTAFTRLTEERGDEVAAGIALRLGEVTVEAVRAQRGRVVKLLGDGVLVRFDDAASAAEGALDLLAALPAAGLPSGHAGMASGPLIVRDGDVFGRTVNLAARISDVAPDGHLYVPDGVASSLSADRFRLTAARGAVLQGIGPIGLVDVVRAAS